MSRKATKLLSIVLTVVMLATMVTPVFAANTGVIKPNSITANFNSTASTSIQDVGKSVMGVIQTVGVVISVVILSIIGIKYMMGSASEKAEYKKTMIPYLVGAILIFAASTLANVVYNFATGLNA